MIESYDKIDLQILYKNDYIVLKLLDLLEDLENENEELQDVGHISEAVLELERVAGMLCEEPYLGEGDCDDAHKSIVAAIEILER